MLLDGQPGVLEPDATLVRESVERAWYDSPSSLGPAEGRTHARFTGYDTAERYSWVKAPRLAGRPMEVGPLARMLVAYESGVLPVRRRLDPALSALGIPGRPRALITVIGRVLARSVEAKYVVDQMGLWVRNLVGAVWGGETSYFDEPADRDGGGAGLWEAPRGALGHWVDIRGGTIANYQVISPSTWNCCPRDADGVRGPLEQALVGTPIVDVTRPLEALRVVRSFDPCMGCAVQVLERKTGARAGTSARPAIG
jgi:Ni,Fe-hydrogenase I large subunit